MSLAEVRAIEDDWRAEQEIEERRFGRILAFFANAMKDSKKTTRVFKEEDFILKMERKDKKPKDDEESPEAADIRAKLTSILGPPRKHG